MVRAIFYYAVIVVFISSCGDNENFGDWATFTIDDGLPGYYVYSVTETIDRVIWVSCAGGIAKFEGANFTPYTVQDGLPSGECITITEYDGKMAVGTDSGLAVFDGQNFTVYTTNDGLPSDNILSLDCGLDGLWIGTDSGLSFFDGISFINYDTNNSEIAGNTIWALCVTGSSVIIGTDKGLSIFTQPDSWQKYTKGNGLPSDIVQCLWVDKGVIWGGTANGAFKLEGGKIISYTIANSGLTYNDVMGVCVDREGDVWFATYGGGISRFSDDGWKTYKRGDGPISDYIFCAFVSSYNTLWFGTTSGLSRYVK
ncbi:MAG: ligand-binding sensor domain-containing protein [bacterium]